MYLFNVRVYGILVNERKQVLITDERVQHFSFTKFPGGGLEYGEGLIDALKREFIEECGLEIEVIKHIYTTDFFEKSSFNTSQVISIYYQIEARSDLAIELKSKPFDFPEPYSERKQEVFRWIDIEQLKEENLTFRTDKIAWRTFLSYHSN